MILRIDMASSTPVYAQIVDQIKRAVATGTLKSGDSLPSLRETAVTLRINPLTVGKAYKQLEHEGLIQTKHGLGSFITWNGGACTEEYRRSTLSRAVDDLLVDAYHLGVSFDELRDLVQERIEIANNGFAREGDERSNEDER